MTLADTAVYLAVVGTAGPAADAVTSSLNIHFLRRPRPGDLVAEVRLLRLGGRGAVGEVAIYSDGEPEPVAHATVGYALPRAGAG